MSTWDDNALREAAAQYATGLSLADIAATAPGLSIATRSFPPGRFRSRRSQQEPLHHTAHAVGLETRRTCSTTTWAIFGPLRVNGWKQILSILTIHYGDRIEAAS